MDETKRKNLTQLISNAVSLGPEMFSLSKLYIDGITHSDIRELEKEYDVTKKNFKDYSLAFFSVSDKVTLIFVLKDL